MRALLVVTFVTAGHSLANACPRVVTADEVVTDEVPATSPVCMQAVDFGRSRRVFEVRHAEGAGGVTRSGIGGLANMFVALDLAIGLQFGNDPEQPSYEIELSGGAALQRTEGAVAATGLTTHGALRFGPARVAESVIDTGRGNLAFFPLTMEVSHTGEVAGRPRMSARPELTRSLYSRERVELATRILRVEGAGEKAQTTAPGLSEKRKPSAWALDVLPLHAGLDVALQDATRIEATVGGAMLGVVDHSLGAKLDLLSLEHRHIDLAMIGPKSIDTVWMLRLDGVNPHTGSQYMVGWGEVVVTDELRELAQFIDPEDGNLTVGGAGWYSAPRDWGGFGMQYKREPYMTMMGEIGLEDRLSGEVYVPRALGLTAKVFGARTTRWIDGGARHDVTGGVELDASYTTGHWIGKVGVELGRTYYNALDNTLPTTAGFGAALDFSVQHASTRSWR